MPVVAQAADPLRPGSLLPSILNLRTYRIALCTQAPRLTVACRRRLRFQGLELRAVSPERPSRALSVEPSRQVLEIEYRRQ